MILAVTSILLALIVVLEDPILSSATYVGIMVVFFGCVIYLILERRQIFGWRVWPSLIISGGVVFWGYSGVPKISVDDVCEAVVGCSSVGCNFVSSGGVEFQSWSSREVGRFDLERRFFIVRRGLFLRGYIYLRRDSDDVYNISYGKFVFVHGVRDGSVMACSREGLNNTHRSVN